MMSERTRAVIALVMAMLVALSVVQTSGASLGFVFAQSNPAYVTTQLTSQASSSTKQPANETFSLHVQPSTRTITAGSYAEFNVSVTSKGSSNILLAARGLPQHSTAIFTPQSGVATPDFHSSLTIITRDNTPPGTSDLSVVALTDGRELSSNIGLTINSTLSPTSTVTLPGTPVLSVIVGTDQNFYAPNSTVTVQGFVTDNSGDAVPSSSMAVQVDGPTGTELEFITNITTDVAGAFGVNVKLPVTGVPGTYTVFASANKSGYTAATTHTTFVVNSSSTPSIMISQVYATDSAGNPSGVFSTGQTILIWVVLQNYGAPTQAVIWVQIINPGNNPVSIQLQISTLNTHGTVKVAFGYTPKADSQLGVYTVNALVSDKLISEGGTFLANADAQFALTG